MAVCEAVWLKRILKDLGVPIKDPTPLYCDNMSNIYLARNPVFHARTKHIKVHYHFIRERVLASDVDQQHISTNLQMAEIFTKALRADKLWQFMTDLGLTILDLPSLRGSTAETTHNARITQLRITQAEARTSHYALHTDSTSMELRITQAEARTSQLCTTEAEAAFG